MKRHSLALCGAWLLVATLSLGASAIWGQSAASSAYNAGNALYRDGDFAGALARYREAAATGVEDPRLYYNLANALFKTGSLGEAILWYERALRLDPRDPDIKANLRFVNQIKKDREVQGETNLILDFLSQVFIYPGMNELAFIFFVCLMTIFGLATWRLWNRDRVGGGWVAAMTVSVFFALLVGAWLGGRAARLQERDQAIVLVSEATAHSAPDAGKTAVFIVHEGTKVRIERHEQDWVLIRLLNGLGGWIPADAIEAI